MLKVGASSEDKDYIIVYNSARDRGFVRVYSYPPLGAWGKSYPVRHFLLTTRKDNSAQFVWRVKMPNDKGLAPVYRV